MCDDGTNHRVAKGEVCIREAIGGIKESIAKPSIETRVGATTKKHGRESTEAHNS